MDGERYVETSCPVTGIAVIGAGYWGPNLVRNAQATPGLRLEYLCDLDVSRARKVLGDYSTVRVSGSIDEVLADPAVLTRWTRSSLAASSDSTSRRKSGAPAQARSR